MHLIQIGNCVSLSLCLMKYGEQDIYAACRASLCLIDKQVDGIALPTAVCGSREHILFLQ